MRFIYSQYASVDTVDFSDVALDEDALKRFETRDLINPRPAIFARAISMEERRAELLQRGLTLKEVEEQEEEIQSNRAAAGGVGAASGGSERQHRSGSRSVLNPLSPGGSVLSSPRSTSSRSERIASMQGVELSSTGSGGSGGSESEPEGKAPPATERTVSGNERVSANWLPRPHKRNSGPSRR